MREKSGSKSQNRLKCIQGQKPAVFAMLHVPALTGTPANRLGTDAIVDHVESEARVLIEVGVDGLILENMHDRPYRRAQVGPEIVADMTRVASALRSLNQDLPIGIQILAAANREALAVAKSADLDFIRAEAFVFGHLADEGWMDAQAADLLRYRKQIDAEHVCIFTDIQKKHSAHAMSSDLSIEDWAEAAEFNLSDGLIITGKHTGKAANATELNRLKEITNLPLIIGSGLNSDNAQEYISANAWIVGSSLKVAGRWDAEIDPAAVEKLIKARNQLQ
jgi:membrane complex biogenesis BtpA family protein